MALSKLSVVAMVGMKDSTVKSMASPFGASGREYATIAHRKVSGIFCENRALPSVSDVAPTGVRPARRTNFAISSRLPSPFSMISTYCCIHFNLGLGYLAY